jgi:hypothetical protein
MVTNIVEQIRSRHILWGSSLLWTVWFCNSLSLLISLQLKVIGVSIATDFEIVCQLGLIHALISYRGSLGSDMVPVSGVLYCAWVCSAYYNRECRVASCLRPLFNGGHVNHYFGWRQFLICVISRVLIRFPNFMLWWRQAGMKQLEMFYCDIVCAV